MSVSLPRAKSATSHTGTSARPAKAGNPSGLILHDARQSPCHSAIMERVVPQAGQGRPEANLKTQGVRAVW